jgi:hypothetical protein
MKPPPSREKTLMQTRIYQALGKLRNQKTIPLLIEAFRAKPDVQLRKRGKCMRRSPS